jgi:hypothetical protein
VRVMVRRERQIATIIADKESSPALHAKMDTIRMGLMHFRQNVVLLRDAERPDHFSPVHYSYNFFYPSTGLLYCW